MATTDPTITLEPIVNAKGYEGQKLTEIVDVNGPVSYTTGGFPLPSSTANAAPFMGTVEVVLGGEVFRAADGASVRLGAWVTTTKKMQLFVPETGAEVANGVDVSTYKARVKLIGY